MKRQPARDLAARARRNLRPGSTKSKPAGPAFNAFIAYADIPASRLAIASINDVLRAAKRGHRLNPMLWKFSQLPAGNWREAAVREALRADVIVLASSTPGTLPAELEGWLSDLVVRSGGRRMTLVVLLGPNDAWTVTLERVAQSPAPIQVAPVSAPKALALAI